MHGEQDKKGYEDYHIPARCSHPLSGINLGSEIRELGQARVVSVLEAMSIGRLITDVMQGQPIKVKN